MSRRPSISVVAAAFLIVAAPLVGPALGQGTGEEGAEAQGKLETRTITFYGHVFGHNMSLPMPANTEFPYGEENYGLGTFDYCTPVEKPPAIPDPLEAGVNDLYSGPCEKDPTNKLVFYSTAGFVDIKSSTEFAEKGYTIFHNERGQTKDILLDTSQRLTATIYMTVDAHAWSVANDYDSTYCPVGLPPDVGCPYPYWGWDPGVQPQWVVSAKLYKHVLGTYGGLESTPPDIRTPWENGEGTLIAEGATPPLDVVNGLPGYPHVNEFTIDLGTPKVDRIVKEESFYVVFSFASVLNGGQYSWHSWRLWGGEFFPPRFTLPVKNPFDVELVLPQFIHDKLVILGVMNTPWGSYDLDQRTVKLAVEDARGNAVEPGTVDFVADYSVAHGGHYKPVNATWIWDHRADALPPGAYKVTVTASNFQRTASSSTSAIFTILEDGSPGPVAAGRSGVQTVTEEQLQAFEKGARKAAGGEDDGEGEGKGEGEGEGGGDASLGAPIPPLAPLLGASLVPVALRSRRRLP